MPVTVAPSFFLTFDKIRKANIPTNPKPEKIPVVSFDFKATVAGAGGVAIGKALASPAKIVIGKNNALQTDLFELMIKGVSIGSVQIITGEESQPGYLLRLEECSIVSFSTTIENGAMFDKIELSYKSVRWGISRWKSGMGRGHEQNCLTVALIREILNHGLYKQRACDLC